MINSLSKLALGTVQFGLPYGISNKTGQVSVNEIALILAECQKRGIYTLDTASAYGKSESVLGEVLEQFQFQGHFQIISKLSPQPTRSVREELESSLKRLKAERLDGYLFHHFKTWFENPSLWDQMLSVKEAGLVDSVGFSLYHPEELEDLWTEGICPDFVQVPFSVLDQRFLPFFEECTNRNIRVHIRSVFLQGLVFLDPERLDGFFLNAVPALRRLRETSEDLGLSTALLCLLFPLLNPHVEKVLIGIESVENLKENCRVEEIFDQIASNRIDWDRYSVRDSRILLPVNWPLKA